MVSTSNTMPQVTRTVQKNLLSHGCGYFKEIRVTGYRYT